jgi:hypothetical protein
MEILLMVEEIPLKMEKILPFLEISESKILIYMQCDRGQIPNKTTH